jgi:phage baseplate assembly protein W
MADLTLLTELAQDWGGDLSASPTGDLAVVSGVDRSKQRVLRRLLTNPGDYLFHPTYGAGLPRYVGQLVDVAKVRALIRGQMLLEDSVASDPEPQVEVSAIPNGLSASISYITSPEKIPAVLSFSLNG